MLEKLRKIASAIKRLSDDKIDDSLLYAQVMSMDGYDEQFLISAFDYLMEHEKQAKAFMVRSDNLKRAWLDKIMFRGTNN
ncbi:Uncharacterized protein TCM_008714 [Theobroma cacao]|uniref:Uncharacterized protein n=1 Tax=Theobroma cacao TaxID=3641 RepID=A0A061E445_THECC|nr:Uncharacterized protein TCM_008714 [Theobroma cacao]